MDKAVGELGSYQSHFYKEPVGLSVTYDAVLGRIQCVVMAGAAV
jgi:hypothetical protein